MSIRIKRIDEAIEAADGIRVFVGCRWPAGVTSQRAELDKWMWELAPSPVLMEWGQIHSGQRSYRIFKKEYLRELAQDPRKEESITELLWLDYRGTVTLLYAPPDEKRNSAEILREFLQERKIRYRYVF